MRPVAHADELHFARTPDGWRLALHRYRPQRPDPGTPVILCSGYACNRWFIDYDERYSLARFLARLGFDAWVLELRGRGLSYPATRTPQTWQWTFDELATIDVPAAIAHVTGVTAHPVRWVGHSMGGMVLYAHLGTAADPGVVAGVTIASPVTFPPAGTTLMHRLGTLLLDLPLGDVVPQRWALGALWWLVGWTSALEVGMNPANVDHAVVGRALRHALSDVSRAKLRQLGRWATEGTFTSADETVDYRAALARVTTPLLLVAGTADRLATPECVRLALEHLPPDAVTYREFGRAHGHDIDYGHVDLVLGRAAPDEVFPAIGRWLREHDEGG
jgi:predicted alpha/beta hydrolase